MDYRSGSSYGVHFIDPQIGVGSGTKRKMDLFVTTSQQELAMITTGCPNPAICDVPSGYNKRKVKKISNSQYQTRVVRFFDKLQLTETKLTVNKAKEQIEMWYHKYHRYAQFDA